MRLQIAINRAGDISGTYLIHDRAATLMVTPAAAKEMIRHADETGKRCKRCGILAMPNELENNKCGPLIGCATDVDSDVWDGSYEEQGVMRQGLAVRLFKVARNAILGTDEIRLEGEGSDE